MQDIGIIEDGALWLEDGIIRQVGTTREILAGLTVKPDQEIDATGRRRVSPEMRAQRRSAKARRRFILIKIARFQPRDDDF